MTTRRSVDSGVLNISNGEPPIISQAITTLMASANLAVTLPFPWVTFPIYLWFYPDWHKQRNLLRAFLLDAIDAAKKREDLIAQSGELLTDADCVVDMLIQQERRGGSEAFDTDEMLDELTVFIMWVFAVVFQQPSPYSCQLPNIQWRAGNNCVSLVVVRQIHAIGC
jgi:hypothetical protein